MALPGKSKTITVEPVEQPRPAQVPAPAPAPVKVPEKVPACASPFSSQRSLW